MSQTKTQDQKVLSHLKQGRKISQATAVQKFNAYRLSAIIFRLKEQGHNIEGKYEKVKEEKRPVFFYKLQK